MISDLHETITERTQFDASSNWLVAALLVILLAVGGYYRFVGLNWDDFTHLHPDERFLTQVVSGIGGNVAFADEEEAAECRERYPNHNGNGTYLNGGYFDAQCSALNPNNVGYGLYVYGTLPLFIADVASDTYADALTLLDEQGLISSQADPIYGYDVWRGYNGAHLVWRALNGSADLLAAFFLFLIGRRLHGKWVGLLAAALYIAAPLPIQKAHFATVNSMANLFGVLALYYSVRVLDSGSWADYFAFGLAFAAALASRINLVPLVTLVVVASAVRMLPIFDRKLAWGERQRLINHEFGGLVLAGIVTIVAFRVFQPYAFLGPGFIPLNIGVLLEELRTGDIHSLGIFNTEWLANIQQAQYLVSGAAESPPNYQWVNRTGYVFPLTNMLLWGMGVALGLAAWISWAWSGALIVRGEWGANRNLLPFLWVLVYFAWIGNLWVMSMRYYLPLYPALALLAAWGLVHLWRQTGNVNWAPVRRYAAAGLIVFVVGFTHIWALMFTNIYRNMLTRVQATHWIWETVPGDFAMRVEGAPDTTPLINIGLFNRGGVENQLETHASILEPGLNYTQAFIAPADGTITSVHIPHLGAVNPGAATLRLTITGEEINGAPLATGEIEGEFTRDNHVIGDSYDITLTPPLEVTAGQGYNLTALIDGSPLYITGSIVSHEGAWDDPVPTIVCSLPAGITLADDPPPGLKNARNCNSRNAYSALVNGYSLSMALDDIDLKRDNLKLALDNTDYIVISSNRFYDSLARNPGRWPMTVDYYNALFSGELGFEVAAVFQETFELGPLRVSDQHLPTMNAPAWLNEFEAEEAFHVYDHPVVFVFRKTDEYTPTTTRRLLDSVNLNRADDILVGSFNDPTLIGVNPITSLEADVIPTQLKLKQEAERIQYSNGTWLQRFAIDNLINTQPIVTVTTWWLTLALIGIAAFPLTFAMLPSLADRGYSAAKLVGLFVIAWAAWISTSLHLRLWSTGGLWLTFAAFAALSAYLGWHRRDDLNIYLRTHWGQLLVIEVITLLAFLFFLFVRLTNPDLWHFAFGGEKPMDFAYFNGVLRSTTFPPLDPWHASGYINYYYFGFVLVGVPVLMLGVEPSIAYNLLIPTVFALTGIGAFSVAYNLTAGIQKRRSEHHPVTHTPASPWVAGIMALLLAVLLGNLGTPRVFGSALAQLGGYTPTANLTNFLIEEYTEENGEQPAGEALTELTLRGSAPSFADEMRYNLSEASGVASGITHGLARWLGGERFNIPTNRWYWGPTRILAEPPVSSGNAITEIPYFTFLYGDLHAHMISMPIQFFVILFLLHELFHAGRSDRRRLPTLLVFGTAAASVGMLQGINTWDWPTYLLLSVIGLGFIWWAKWRGEFYTRAAVVDMVLRVGGFIALSVWLSYPYTRWYAAVYSSASLWPGPYTPIWAYLMIHGLFLFLIVSLLVWETHRWLRHVHVRALRGHAGIMYAILTGIGLILFISLGLAMGGWPVTIIVVPLIVWSAVLFFRPRQSRAMQFTLVLISLALAITLGVEYIVIDGDIGRQNTVFKFYLQAWLMFSIVGGVAIAWLTNSAYRWDWGTRLGWFGALGVLLFTAALYPLTATPARAIDRMAPEIGPVLDGMAYMRESTHYEVTNGALGEGEVLELADDYRVIRWLQTHIEGTPVIMEAQSEAEYRWGGRMSIYTGMPSVIGWNWHQRQQRTFDPMPRMVQQRVANVNAFYTTPDTTIKADILQHYQVEYVIVGTLERARYPELGLQALEQMAGLGILEVVYESGPNKVYRVNVPAAQMHALELDRLYPDTFAEEITRAE
jgi:YYY domain-containing protein